MSTVVTMRGVSFELPNGRELFQNIQLSLGDGLTALVGPNGAGKTTLAKLIQGELKPSAGQIRREQATRFFAQREEPAAISVGEYLSADYQWSALGDALLEGIDHESPCTTLSGGQWMRVRLARVLDGDFLLLDEPTNDLDRAGREMILHFLRGRRGGALLISHDREALALCDEVLELSNLGLSAFGGGWTAYNEHKERERAALTRALHVAVRARDQAAVDRREQLRKQDKRNRRGADAAARGGQAKILLGRKKRLAESSTGKIDSASLERANVAVRDTHEALRALKTDAVMYADLMASPIAAQRRVAEAKDFNVYRGRWLYAQNLNFSWRGNVRVALQGNNGSGKSTLLSALMGAELHTRGELRVGTLSTLYIDQRCALLDNERSVIDNVQRASKLGESEIRNGLARFLFANEAVFQKVANLSGGERLRAALACGFLATEKPDLLVLDEPTNNLDLVNIEFLESLVRAFKGALIVISHDDAFVDSCRIDRSLALGA